MISSRPYVFRVGAPAVSRVRPDPRIQRVQPAQIKPGALGVRNTADSLRLGIEAQLLRCTEAIPGGPLDADPDPWMRAVLQRSFDLDFLVVALARFQRLADWALEGAFATADLHAAVAKFRAAVPHLTETRDTQEHFDEYRSNVGRRQLKGELPAGFGYGLSASGGVVTYGPFKFNAAEAVAAAQELHRAIRRDVDPIASNDVHGGPETVLIRHP